MRKKVLAGVLAVVAVASLPWKHSVPTLYAQAFPFAMTVGVDPDASPNAPAGYTVQVNAGPVVDVGLPAVNPACRTFVGGATAPCVPFPISIPAAGLQTVKVVGYNLGGGSSPATTITFNVASGAPSAPGNGRVTK